MVADAVGGVWEKVEDEVAAAGEARSALKENPNEVGSTGACGAVAEVDCAKRALVMLSRLT